MNIPLISVIIPVYNVEHYIIECVESLINQTYRNMEIILVDDGSTDKSGMFCDELKRKHKRIIVVHKENGGLSSARNKGIEIARGEYIGFVDSDDYVEPSMYEELYNAMNINNADVAICGRTYMFDDGKKVKKYTYPKYDIVMDSATAIKEMNSYRYFDMAVWDKLYKRELFENIRFPLGKLSEDYYIMYQVFDCAKKIVFRGKCLYYYRQRKGSISNSKKINTDFCKAAYEQMQYCDMKYPELRDCSHAAYASACMTVYGFYLKARVKCPLKYKRELQDVVRDNLNYIERCDMWPVTKRVQAIIFARSLLIYNMTFYIYKCMKPI